MELPARDIHQLEMLHCNKSVNVARSVAEGEWDWNDQMLEMKSIIRKSAQPTVSTPGLERIGCGRPVGSKAFYHFGKPTELTVNHLGLNVKGNAGAGSSQAAGSASVRPKELKVVALSKLLADLQVHSKELTRLPLARS